MWKRLVLNVKEINLSNYFKLFFKVSDEMCAVAFNLQDDDGKIVIADFVQACLNKEDFSNLLTTKIYEIFGAVE